MFHSRPVLSAAIAIALVTGPGAFEGQFSDVSPDLVREPVIEYFSRSATDPVARLSARLQAGDAALSFDQTSGYLGSILKALDLPVESQLLVFSKTSVQASRITPRNPRAIFFNDRLAVGYIHDAPYLEFAAQDPQQGTVFYTLDQRREEKPVIERRDFCLSCHNTTSTLEVPGMLVRSIATTPTGTTAPRFGNYTSDHRSPLAERWGGWYVNGRHGPMAHLGNAVLADRDRPDAMMTNETLNAVSLKERFDSGNYPTPHSDIVALLVFDHQMRMMNLLTRTGWDARVALGQKRPDLAELMARAASDVVDYMLFVDEVPLVGPISGASGFAQTFAAGGPSDRHGRSLRQLDLSARLMRYPCSYMIYSDAFDLLPAEARGAIYRRLWQILSGADTSARYARLGAGDRRAIVEILRDTKKNLPGYFQPAAH
jgi:hypothetical protein